MLHQFQISAFDTSECINYAVDVNVHISVDVQCTGYAGKLDIVFKFSLQETLSTNRVIKTLNAPKSSAYWIWLINISKGAFDRTVIVWNRSRTTRLFFYNMRFTWFSFVSDHFIFFSLTPPPYPPIFTADLGVLFFWFLKMMYRPGPIRPKAATPVEWMLRKGK